MIGVCPSYISCLPLCHGLQLLNSLCLGDDLATVEVRARRVSGSDGASAVLRWRWWGRALVVSLEAAR